MTPDQQQTGLRRRRWIIFGSIVLLIAIIGGGFYGVRKYRMNQHIDGLKQDGIASIEAGNHEAAYHQFRGYLGKYPEDLEALRGFADAIEAKNEQSDEPSDPNELINAYERILDQDPKDTETRLALIELYHRINYADDVKEHADILLEQEESVRARELKMIQLARLRRYKGEDGALAVGKRLIEVEPTHFNGRVMLLQLMELNNELAEDIMAVGRAPYDANPDSPTAKLIYGYALQLTGELGQAREIFLDLVDSDLKQPEKIRMLAQMLDQTGQGEQAITLLSRAMDQLEGTELRAQLCRRQWERGRPTDLLANFDDPAKDAIQEPDSYPFVLLAANATDDQALLDRLVESGKASDNAYIQAWAELIELGNEIDSDSDRYREMVAASRDASKQFPGDPHLRAIYARSLMMSGFTEESVVQWEQAATDAPGWPVPMQQIAQIMLSTQRESLALEPAKAAVRRGPNLLDSILIYLQAVNANLDRLSSAELNRVSEIVDRLSEEVDHESLVPLRAELTARGDSDLNKELAKQQIKSALDSDKSYGAQTWNALARVSQRHKLGLTEQLIDRARQQHGPVPDLALRHASEVFQDTRSDQAALEAFDQWMQQAERADSVDWQLARTRLQRALDPARATDLWAAMFAKFPGNKLVQMQILRDERNWRTPDRKLVKRVLGRIETAEGESDLAPVRIARSRLKLMEAESDSQLSETQQELEKITRDFPYLSEPHMLLGMCYEQLGNRSAALKAYEAAHRLRPESDALLYARIRMHREVGETETANRMLERHAEELAASGTADPSQLAKTYMAVGRVEDAVRWAERAVEQDPTDRASALLLARLYMSTKRREQAEAIYERLLESPDLDTLIAASSFYMQTGRTERSLELMKKLDDLDIEESTKSMVRGHFSLSSGDVDTAMAEYQAAADRGDTAQARAAFVRLLSIRLQQNDLNGVIQIAKAAAAKVPDEPRFKAIVDNEVLIRSVFGPETAPMIRRLLIDPEQRPVVESALRVVARLKSDLEPGQVDTELKNLRRIADQNQRLIELQNLTTRLYLAAGKIDEAVNLATRTTRAFPNDQSALVTAADANMAAKRWDAAAEAGRRIADLNPNYRSSADVVAARAALRRGLPNEALRLIEPYLETAAELPESHGPVIRMQLAALIAANRKPDALGPLSEIVADSLTYRVFAVDQIVTGEQISYETTQAWVRWALKDQTLSEQTSALWIKAATAWHITGIKTGDERATDRAAALLSELGSQEASEDQARLMQIGRAHV